MTEIFLNGGFGSGFAGVEFNNGTDILNQILTTATAAGFTVELDDIATNKKLILKGTYPSTTNEAFLVFEEIDNPATASAKYLRMRGGDDALETNTSPNFDADFTEGSPNQLWLGSESFALNLSLRSSLGTFKLWHGGYPKHVDIANDPYPDGAWYVGWYTVRKDDVYVCKAAHNGALWRKISDDYDSYANFKTNSNTSIPIGTFDFLTTALKPRSNYDFENDSNAGFKAYRGSVNGVNNKPAVVELFFYGEGRGSTTNYISPGNDLPAPLYFRGPIWGGATGLASLVAGNQVYIGDPQTGKRYITGDIEWEGFRIN